MTARPYGIYVHNLRVEATVPYKLEWLDEMKLRTMWNERHWDAASKTWWFPVTLAAWVIQLCRRHFPHVPSVYFQGTVDAHSEPFRAEYTEKESEYARKTEGERAARRAEHEREEARRRGAQKAPPPPRGGFGEDWDTDFEFDPSSGGGFGDFFDAFFRARGAGKAYAPPTDDAFYGGGRRRPPPPPPVRGGGPATLEQAYVELLRELPPETLAKVYKVAIASAHPDAGGTHEKAVAINRAWDAIKKFRRIT